MPTFRERPLTWLFVVATVCVDLAAWGAGQYESRWFNILLLSQITCLGVWAALGQSHRLARAAVVVAAVLALALPDYWTSAFLPQVHSAVLTQIALSTALVAIAAFVWSLLLSPFSQRRQKPSSPLQFSIVELLGWMIIVAVVAASARVVNSSAVRLSAEFFILGFLGSALGSLPLVMWRMECFAPRIRALISTIVLVAFLAVVAFMERSTHNVPALILLFAYQGCWHKVQQLDESGSLL